jgi:hypothetical protein
MNTPTFTEQQYKPYIHTIKLNSVTQAKWFRDLAVALDCMCFIKEEDNLTVVIVSLEYNKRDAEALWELFIEEFNRCVNNRVWITLNV